MNGTDGIRLDGKVALITGAAGEIGTATMQLMTRRGARIVAVDRNAAALAKAIATLPADSKPVSIVADVTQEREVEAYVHKALETAGTIDIFFNNAGIEGEIAPIVNYPLEKFRHVLDVNVTGVFLGMKHVLPIMLEKDEGSIINTASVCGADGLAAMSRSTVPRSTPSSASPRALRMKSPARKVRINCVCPGLIDSRMLSAIFAGRNPGADSHRPSQRKARWNAFRPNASASHPKSHPSSRF